MLQLSPEIEGTLLIYSDHPQQVMRKIANLPAIAGYTLAPQPGQKIQDCYVDTPTRALLSRGLVLRIRMLDEVPLITLKGPAYRTGGGIKVRLELEKGWSPDALLRINKELAEAGISLIQSELEPEYQSGYQSELRAESQPETKPASSLDTFLQQVDMTQPLVVLKKLGWEVIQKRKTDRQIRNIVHPIGPPVGHSVGHSHSVGRAHSNEEKSPLIGEMALDSVVYYLNQQPICHYEVEVEAKTEAGVSTLKPIMAELEATFGPVLKFWPYGKSAIGAALQAFLDADILDSLLDDNNTLKPVAYDRINDYLQGG